MSLVTRTTAGLIYRGLDLLYRTAPGPRTLRFLLHVNKYVGQATWMVVCRHFERSPLRNERLMRFTREFLDAHIEADDTVLDVGCHEGHLTRYMAARCRRVIGVDRDAALVARARAFGTPPNVEFRVGDVRALGTAERFDVVCLHHVLEHLDDAPGVLARLGAMAPRILIEVPDIEQSWTNSLLRELGGDYFGDATHVREYDAELLRAHVGAAGLKVAELRQVAGVLQAVARG